MWLSGAGEVVVSGCVRQTGEAEVTVFMILSASLEWLKLSVSRPGLYKACERVSFTSLEHSSLSRSVKNTSSGGILYRDFMIANSLRNSAFSFSNEMHLFLIWCSTCLLFSRDFFADKLFFFRFSQYFRSFSVSGMPRFSDLEPVFLGKVRPSMVSQFGLLLCNMFTLARSEKKRRFH